MHRDDALWLIKAGTAEIHAEAAANRLAGRSRKPGTASAGTAGEPRFAFRSLVAGAQGLLRRISPIGLLMPRA